MNLPDAYCHQCDAVTPTVYIPLKGGIGNCCSACRTCRKGRPYVSKLEYAKALERAKGNTDEQHTRA